MRPNHGLDARHYDKYIGKKIKKYTLAFEKNTTNRHGINIMLLNQLKNEDTRLLAIKNLKGSEKEKVVWMLANMSKNKVFKYKNKLSKGKSDRDFLEDLKSRYLEYRENWRLQPKKSFKNKLYGKNFKNGNNNPLCIDIEVASVCDLACPHCYRQYISTPDKIMDPDLALNSLTRPPN